VGTNAKSPVLTSRQAVGRIHVGATLDDTCHIRHYPLRRFLPPPPRPPHLVSVVNHAFHTVTQVCCVKKGCIYKATMTRNNGSVASYFSNSASMRASTSATDADNTQASQLTDGTVIRTGER